MLQVFGLDNKHAPDNVWDRCCRNETIGCAFLPPGPLLLTYSRTSYWVLTVFAGSRDQTPEQQLLIWSLNKLKGLSTMLAILQTLRLALPYVTVESSLASSAVPSSTGQQAQWSFQQKAHLDQPIYLSESGSATAPLTEPYPWSAPPPGQVVRETFCFSSEQVRCLCLAEAVNRPTAPWS
jgi:hypothetical protein